MSKFQIAVLSILALIACAIFTGLAVMYIAITTPRAAPAPTNTPGPSPTPVPTSTPAPTPTPIIYDFEGRGDDVLFFDVPVSGPGFVGASYAGDSNFAITLYRADGEYIDLLVNDIGKYDGRTNFVARSAGQYYLKVEARGRDFVPNWVIRVIPPQ